MLSRDRPGSYAGEDCGHLPDASGWNSCWPRTRPRRRPPRSQEPTSRTGRGDLPDRHRTEDPDRAETASHRRGRGPQRGEQITPRTAQRLGHRPVHPSPANHLQQVQPDRFGPAAHHPQPAPHRRRRNTKLWTDRAVSRPAGPGLQRRPDHLGRVRPPRQHRDRQQHVRHQAPRAASPTWPQHASDAVHPPWARPPPRTQRRRAVRAVDLPGRQPRLDPDLICLYRHQRVPPRIQHGPPAASSRTYGGRAVVVFCASILAQLGTVMAQTTKINE